MIRLDESVVVLVDAMGAMSMVSSMALSFATYFGVTSEALDEYGAFDISLESDLPVFIDPFLLFNSENPEYQKLHESIIQYLAYLRDLSAKGSVDEGTLRNLYCFKEVKQNWLGFTFMGNGGSGLGMAFAHSLNRGLHDIFANFGSETITRGSHLEKVSLVRGGVGRDNMSDFVTNLIKEYLLDYTARFAREHVHPALIRSVRVSKVAFNYDTESWVEKSYDLPHYIQNGKSDFVLLTPSDMLTRDQMWISSDELHRRFERIPESISDSELRGRINSYFQKAIGKKKTKESRNAAVVKTLEEFPELVDYYIRLKELEGDKAAAKSLELVRQVEDSFRVRAEAAALALFSKTSFYKTPLDAYDDALRRVQFFKQYIENQDGYLLINPKDERFATEKSVQLFFGLVWFGSPFDINREVNNGRGPVDFKSSYGDQDKSLIELKLASNTALKKNMERQVKIYEDANRTRKSIKVIICYTARHQSRVAKILKDLNLHEDKSIVVVDARRDNKPSGSKA